MTPHPPALAERLLSVATPQAARAPVLGDLQEEFCELAGARSVDFARRWYWRQTVGSAWRMAVLRAQDARLGPLLGVTIIAYAAITVWDRYAARAAASFAYDAFALDDYSLARLVFYLVQYVGLTAVGAAIGWSFFRQGAAFWREALIWLAPIALVLIVSIATTLLRAGDYPATALIGQFASIAPCLLIGAWIGRDLKRRSRRR